MSDTANDATAVTANQPTNATSVIAVELSPGDVTATNSVADPSPTSSGSACKRKHSEEQPRKGKQGATWTNEEEVAFLEARYSELPVHR